jgi:hypothetical protein
MSVETKINLNGRIQRLVEVVEGDPKALEGIFKVMDRIYRAFIRLRWRRFSKGGGNWAPLSPLTVKRKGNDLILIDTKLAYESVSPEFEEVFSILPNKRTQYKAVVTFGSKEMYPSGISVNQVMSYHQEGTDSMPARPVLVSPDTATKRNMERKCKEEITKYLRTRK